MKIVDKGHGKGHAYNLADSARMSIDSVITALNTGDLQQGIARSLTCWSSPEHMFGWTLRNQALAGVFAGNLDVRSNWTKVGRKVYGDKWANPEMGILQPIFNRFVVEDEETGKPVRIKRLVGYTPIPVWDISDTYEIDAPWARKKWAKEKARLEKWHAKVDNYMATLPLTDLLDKWNFNLVGKNTAQEGAAGWFSRWENEVALGIEDELVFFHELAHAADYMNGTLTENGNQSTSETVAEVVANALAISLGYEEKIDLVWSWNYIASYSNGSDEEARKVMMSLMARIQSVIEFIVKEAQMLEHGLETDEEYKTWLNLQPRVRG